MHGLLTNINKNSGKKLNSDPHPLGDDFYVFFENFRRRSGRVLKLHRGFILSKKGDINPQQNLETPLALWGGAFRFKKNKIENFKNCLFTSKGLREMF